MTKNWGKNYRRIFFFFSKTTIYLSLGLHKGRPSYRRSLQLSKENIKYFKTWDFSFFLFLWVIFALLDPDLDSKHSCSAPSCCLKRNPASYVVVTPHSATNNLTREEVRNWKTTTDVVLQSPFSSNDDFRLELPIFSLSLYIKSKPFWKLQLKDSLVIMLLFENYSQRTLSS